MALTGNLTGSLSASMSAEGGVNGLINFDGSGTDNYNELDNKPSINGVVLAGNKTSEDLHINNEGTDNYNELLNKPKINGTTLTGDVSDTQLLIDYNHLINKPVIPDVSEIETRLDTAETDIDNLQTNMVTAQNDIATIKATDLTQNADINSLKNRVTGTETNISNLTTRVSSAETSISNHTTEISSIEDNVTGLDTRVGTAEGDIDTLQGDMTQAQSDISELNSRFTTITSGSIYDISKQGIYYLTSAVTDKPIASGGVYVVGSYNDETITGIFISVYTNEVFQIRKNSSTRVTNRISIETVEISGTTSSTGAIPVPISQQGKRFLNALLTTGSPGFVARRDGGFFTVYNNDGTIKSNTAVVFEAYFV